MSETVSLISEHIWAPIVLGDDHDLAALVALAGLPGLAPKRLWSLVDVRGPAQAWKMVRAGKAPLHGRPVDAAHAWPGWAARVDPARALARHQELGVAVLPFGHQGYPDALLDDPEPPAVLFRHGPSLRDDRPRVAIVGTRKATPYGCDVARELGAALARNGVDVVSGLASGIDAAAHDGASSQDPARVVAVVAGGVDVVYPKRNAGLFKSVAASGALISEWPLGARPETWRFPARNRIVAALAAATVVVESPIKGGSMYTVDEALHRNRAVFAVPGPIKSPVSLGTNRLIAEGAHILCSVAELVESVAPVAGGAAVQTDLGLDSWLLEIIGWTPISLDDVVSESGRSAAQVNLEVERLLSKGAVRRLGGVVERLT